MARMTSLGDTFPVVPVTHFVEERASLGDAWHLVGPTIKRNYRKSSQQDLYCIAFIEGMRMALYAVENPQ